MKFQEFREVNVRRCNQAFFPIENWSPTDWGCALAGEVGELCNLLKKMRRGEKPSIRAIADEIADVFTYLDLLAARLGIDLEPAIIQKFNEVSERRASNIKIPLSSPLRPCSCNKHADCDEANRKAAQQGRVVDHCHNEDCEDCFGQ